MGKKAEGDHTPKGAAIQKMAPEQPPLDDDEYWLSIEDAHGLRAKRTHDIGIAIIELHKELTQGRLRCMAQSTVTGERKLVAPAKWADIMLYSGKDGVRVVHRHHPGEPDPNIVKPFRGWLFYVWQPDFARIWPPDGARVRS